MKKDCLGQCVEVGMKVKVNSDVQRTGRNEKNPIDWVDLLNFALKSTRESESNKVW